MRQAVLSYMGRQWKERGVSDNGLRKLAFGVLVVLIFYVVASAGASAGAAPVLIPSAGSMG